MFKELYEKSKKEYNLVLQIIFLILITSKSMQSNVPSYIGNSYITEISTTCYNYNVTDNANNKINLIKQHIQNYRSIDNGKDIIETNVINHLSLLPYNFLKTFFDNGFNIIISNSSEEGTNTTNNVRTLAKTDYDQKYIVIYKEDTQGYSITHEMGHWFTFYVEDCYDNKIFDRVSDNMVREIDNKEDISDFSRNYYKSDKYETCAALFESYIVDKEKRNESFPISTSFFDYYMQIFNDKNII